MSIRVLVHLVIATGLRPRDEKVGSDGSVRFGYNTILSLRGGQNGRRGNQLHAMDAYGQCDPISLFAY